MLTMRVVASVVSWRQGAGCYARAALVGRGGVRVGGFTVSTRETPTGVRRCRSYRSGAGAWCGAQRLGPRRVKPGASCGGFGATARVAAAPVEAGDRTVILLEYKPPALRSNRKSS